MVWRTPRCVAAGRLRGSVQGLSCGVVLLALAGIGLLLLLLLLRPGLLHCVHLEGQHAAQLSGHAANLVAQSGLPDQAADGAAERLAKLADQVAEQALRRDLSHRLLRIGLLHRIGLEGEHAAELGYPLGFEGPMGELIEHQRCGFTHGSLSVTWQAEVADLLTKAGQPIAEKARELVPVDQGDLKQSISVSARIKNKVGNAEFSAAMRAGLGKAAAVRAMRDARRADGGSFAEMFVGPAVPQGFYGHLVEFGTRRTTAHAISTSSTR